jgi:pimeloyl-ACP methyl ester carboxylesterase
MSTARPGGIRFAVRNNVRIAFDPGSAPSIAGADSVVLLHDLLADRSSFKALRDALADEFTIISPDARGHGASATVTNQWYTVAELALDVLAVMDLEEIHRAHLVGHGLGGATAFELARRYGERVRSLTLIDPALYGVLDNDQDTAAVHFRNERRASDRAAADSAYKGLIDRSLDAYLVPRRGPNWRETTAKPTLGAIRRHAASLAGLAPALDAYTIAKPELRQFLVPTVLITGDDADELDRLTAARLEALLPVARSVTIPSGSMRHWQFDGLSSEIIASVIRELVIP